MSPRRGRRGAALLGLLALLAVAVGGVLVLLNSIDLPTPMTAGCTAVEGEDSADLAPDQAANAAMIAAVAVERGLPARAVTIALATAMQESKLRNIDYGDRDSVGLFQQRPSQGWGTVEQIMDPIYATDAFYDALVQVEDYRSMAVTEAAQAVQRSAFPDAYAQHEPMARLFASALTGHSTAALSCQWRGTEESDFDLTSLLVRDFPSATLTDVPDGSQLALTGEARYSWALAHWAVATARITGVTQVSIAGQAWRMNDDGTSAWSEEAANVPDGVVVVTLAG
ncbi:MAG: hypothetical protein ACK5H2_06855 [Beutenbergiaceae bacterium]